MGLARVSSAFLLSTAAGLWCVACGGRGSDAHDRGGDSVLVSITRQGNGTGTVTSSPGGIDCGGTCSASFGTGTQVTLTATASGDSTFAGWDGACTGVGVCTLTIASPSQVTATFTLNRHTLVVAKTGDGDGLVTSDPSGIDCGADCTASYDSGTVVTLSAVPSDGRFAGWSGGGCSGIGPCTASITAETTVTATFARIVVTGVTSPTAEGIYPAASTIPIQVTFTDPVTVLTGGGTPTLSLNSGGAASYASGSGTTTLTFEYTVAAGELADDLDYDAANALALNGGTVKDAAGNDATLTLPEPGAAGSLGANENLAIDAVAPVVSAITGPASPSSSTSATLAYSISETHPGSTSCVHTVGTGTMTSCTSTAATFDTLSRGPHTVTVSHTDLAGNVSNTSVYTWSVCPYATFTQATAGATFTVPVGCGTKMDIYAWGGGGGGGCYAGGGGGGGGFAGGTLTVTEGQVFTVVVGGGGAHGGSGSAYGAGGTNGGVGGAGGTQVSGGAGGSGAYVNAGTDGSLDQGGAGADGPNGGGGGGGGGLYGGGGGGASQFGGGGGGGGGSSFLDAALAGATTAAGSGQQPGDVTNASYLAGRGVGGTSDSTGATDGGDGLVVIFVHP